MARGPGGGRTALKVRLRGLVAADAPWLDGWLAEAAASAAYDGVERDAPARSLLSRVRRGAGVQARVIEAEGDRAGIVVFRLFTKTPSAYFELVATPPEHARRGHAVQAVGAAEEEMVRHNVRTVYAPAPAAHGIAVYFWLRRGYRPLQRGEWPCEVQEVAWLARELETC